MTDAEIAKAKAHFEYGIKCDIFSEPVLSYAETALEAFDLINRQKAENKDLYKKYCELAKTANERVPVLIKEVQKSKAELKAEAIKEFAERLKEKRYPRPMSQAEYFGLSEEKWVVNVDTIDNLVKEMAGDG